MSLHCNPKTAQGSDNTFCYSKMDHLHGHSRVCGATTIVIGQSSVFVNSRLWAVLGDVCTHGNGQLINTGHTVFIAGIPVIVHAPDPAAANDYCKLDD